MFVFTFILLGFDVVSGLIVLVTVGLIVIDTYGFCVLWDVDMNALTLIITGCDTFEDVTYYKEETNY